MSAALVSTCFCEAADIDAFLDAVLAQTRQPDEIVIVDAGSGDGTLERIRERAAQAPHLRLIVEPGANRSRGRNLAIQSCSADIIAVTDVGCLPCPSWFERIIAPLERRVGQASPEDTTGQARRLSYADVVAGYYRATPVTLWQAAIAAATVPLADEVDAATFLPSARSVAFRREAWERAGGYPERASHNEDTPFGLALKGSGAQFVFEPEAVVEWLPQASVRALFRQFWRYALGDAQEGIWVRHYAKAYLGLLASMALVFAYGDGAWPLALWGFPLLGLAYWVRHALRARHRTRSLGAVLLAPAANLIVDAAHLCGYTRGFVGRPRCR